MWQGFEVYSWVELGCHPTKAPFRTRNRALTPPRCHFNLSGRAYRARWPSRGTSPTLGPSPYGRKRHPDGKRTRRSAARRPAAACRGSQARAPPRAAPDDPAMATSRQQPAAKRSEPSLTSASTPPAGSEPASARPPPLPLPAPWTRRVRDESRTRPGAIPSHPATIRDAHPHRPAAGEPTSTRPRRHWYEPQDAARPAPAPRNHQHNATRRPLPPVVDHRPAPLPEPHDHGATVRRRCPPPAAVRPPPCRCLPAAAHRRPLAARRSPSTAVRSLPAAVRPPPCAAVCPPPPTTVRLLPAAHRSPLRVRRP